MKFPSSRVLALICTEWLLIVVAANLASFFLYQDAQKQLSTAYNMRYQSYALAGELRTSSDDLTRLARTYVVTGERKYEEEYWDVIAIRNGERPRPVEYNRVYWDFVSAYGGKPRPDGEKASFEELLRRAGFTGGEFAKLKEAEDRSNELAKMENVAMNAMKGIYSDDSGAFVEHREPDQKAAVALLFSDDYHRKKAEIMRPIDEFFGLMDRRTNRAVAEAEANVTQYRTLTIVFLGILCVGALAAIWSVLRLRYVNEEKWTKFLLQSGWSVIPNIIIEKQAVLGLDPIDMNIVVHLLHSWTIADELPSPTVEMIAKEIGVSVRTVQKHMADLQASGLITRIERRNTRLGSAANRYSLDGLIRAATPFTGHDLESANASAPPAAGTAARVFSRLGLRIRLRVTSKPPPLLRH